MMNMHKYFHPFTKLYINSIRRTEFFTMDSMHFHDGYEMYYLTEGSRNIFIEDDLYKITAGTILFIKPMEMHYSYTTNDPVHERFAINFNREMYGNALTDDEFSSMVSVFDKRIISLNKEQQRYVTEFLKITEKQALNKNSSFSVKSALAGIMSLCSYFDTIASEGEQSNEDAFIVNAVKYINESFRNDISLADVVKIAKLSESYFCRQFKKITGATFLQYLTNIRLREAHNLLVTTKQTISDIAEISGFSSTAQMTRAFRQNYGISPSELKRTGNSKNI